MLEHLRWRLTVWFVGLSVLLYVALSFSAVVVFNSGLNSVLDQELRGLAREVRPAIELSGPSPTLKAWAANAKREDLSFIATVQLFDPSGKLIEQYGPPAVPRLLMGSGPGGANTDTRVRSRYTDLKVGGTVVGFLQTQVSTKAKDNAMRQLIWTLLILAPFLLVGLGLCGYLYSGAAIKPTAESLGVLRRFVADAGHELNTPITVIQASVETLEKKLENVDNCANLLAMIRRASDRLSDLGHKLTLLAKLERPQFVPSMEPVQLDELVRTTVADFSSAFQAKGVTLTCKATTPIRSLANAESMQTLLSNLMENGLHYTESGGSVAVTLEERGGQVVMVFEDTGIGIPADSLQRIFERFYRVDKSRSRAVGGSGLGLAIVKAIVDAHKGSVRVESSLGQGSRFVVQLPFRSVTPVVARTNAGSNAAE